MYGKHVRIINERIEDDLKHYKEVYESFEEDTSNKSRDMRVSIGGRIFSLREMQEIMKKPEDNDFMIRLRNIRDGFGYEESEDTGHFYAWKRGRYYQYKDFVLYFEGLGIG